MPNVLTDRVAVAEKYSLLDEYVIMVVKAGNAIDFASGSPDPRLFPKEEVRELAQRVINEHGVEAFSYPPPLGLRKLRNAIKSLLTELGVSIPGSKVAITSGAVRAVELVSTLLLNEKSGAVAEEPTYLQALYPLYVVGREVKYIKLKNYKYLNTASLAKVLREPHIKIYYTVPTGHNPTGATFSSSIRGEVAELVREHDVLTIEDDVYRTVLGGEAPEPISAICARHSHPYVYLGSLSKVLAPGFRIAYMLIPEGLFPHIRAIASNALTLSPLNMLMAYEAIRSGFLIKRIRELSREFKERMKTLKDSLMDYMPDCASWNENAEGYYIFIKVKGVNMIKIFNDALRAGVGYVPGDAFLYNSADDETARLCIARPNTEEIPEGVKKLAKVIKDKVNLN